MKTEVAGITRANEGIQGITWNILGQTYVPKSRTEHSFSWHATFPPGTFVPPHIHPDQDEYLYILEGRLDFMLDGADEFAGGQARQPAVLLFFASVGKNVMRHDALNSRAEVNSRASKLLNDDRFVCECAAAPTVFLGHIRQQQPHLSGLAPSLRVRSALLCPSGLVRRKLLGDEFTDHLSKHPRLLVHPRRFEVGQRHLSASTYS